MANTLTENNFLHLKMYIAGAGMPQITYYKYL